MTGDDCKDLASKTQGLLFRQGGCWIFPKIIHCENPHLVGGFNPSEKY